MERAKPEYPGVLALKIEMPMDPQVAETLRILLAADGPVTFGPGMQHKLPEDVSKRFGIKSFMSYLPTRYLLFALKCDLSLLKQSNAYQPMH